MGSCSARRFPSTRAYGLGPAARVYGLGLAAYAGIFLAVGVGEFLAEAHSEPSVLRLAATLGGVGLVYAVTTLLPG